MEKPEKAAFQCSQCRHKLEVDDTTQDIEKCPACGSNEEAYLTERDYTVTLSDAEWSTIFVNLWLTVWREFGEGPQLSGLNATIAEVRRQCPGLGPLTGVDMVAEMAKKHGGTGALIRDKVSGRTIEVPVEAAVKH